MSSNLKDESERWFIVSHHIPEQIGELFCGIRCDKLWTGIYWKPDTQLQIWEKVREFTEAKAKKVQRDFANVSGDMEAATLRSKTKIAAIETLARSDERHAASSSLWNPDPMILATPSGVVDLRTGEPRAARPTDFATQPTRVGPAVEGAEHPIWSTTLDEVTGGDKQLQAYLQHMAGYVATGETREHALFFLYRPGGNGKGTFKDTLYEILGDYAKGVAISALMKSNRDRHPTDVYKLLGHRRTRQTSTLRHQIFSRTLVSLYRVTLQVRRHAESMRCYATNGYGPGDILKFNTKDRPTHVTAEAQREAKRQVLEEAASHRVKLFCSFILHRVASSPQNARRNEINRICYHFNCYLNRVSDHGLVLIDTFQDTSLLAFLRQKFSLGLKGLPYSNSYRLDRLLGLHLASIGSSHFCSVVDVVLGALRYGINARNDASRQTVAQTLLGQLAPLVIRTGSGKVDELSVFFSPKTIRVPSYLKEYRDLHDFLAANGLDCH